jgi:putative peptidoglycan lipid II flippase
MNRSAAGVVALLAALGLGAGYARDAALAFAFGASAMTDAFFVATLIPNVLGTVLVAGALTPALIPVLGHQDHAAAEKLFNLILTLFGLVLLGICVVVAWQAAAIVHFLAPGIDPARTLNAVRLVLITTPAIWLLGIATLLGAFANVRGMFAAPASATLFVNGAMFIAVFLAARNAQLEWVGWGMVVGAAALVLFQVWQLRRRGWRFAPRLARDSGAREVLRLFVPLLLFVLLAQTVPVVERRLSAGFPEGNLSHVAYASKLYQIPATLVPTSFVIVLFPALVHVLRDEHASGYVDMLREGIRSILFVMLPVAIFFGFAAPALVRAVFQRGEFTAADTAATANLLRFYSLAIVPAGLLLVLTRGLHARRDMIRPLLLGIVNTILYIALARFLLAPFGLVALPLAFTFSQVFGVVGAGAILARQLRVSPKALCDATITRIGIAAIPMFALTGLGAAFLPAVETQAVWFTIVVWTILGAGGALSFYLLALRLGVPDAWMLREKIFRARRPAHQEVSA